MTWLWVILVGRVSGWLASIIMRNDAQMGILSNIAVGIVGAFLGGLFVTSLFGGLPITRGAFDFRSLLASFLGTVILLGIINLLRRGALW